MPQKFLGVRSLDSIYFYFHSNCFEVDSESRIPQRLLRFLLDCVANDDIAGFGDDSAELAHPQPALQVLLYRVDFRLQVPHRVQLPVVQHVFVAHQLELQVLLQDALRAPAAQHRDFLLAFGDVENLQYVRLAWG